MKKVIMATVAAWLLPCAAVRAASVSVSTLADSEDGLSYGIDGRFSLTDHWSVGAGLQQSETSLGGADFSGTAVQASSDVNIGAFTAGVSLRRWKDSSQVNSTTIQGEAGWMWDNGLSMTALLDDRDVRVEYTATVLGQTRQANVEFQGAGYGADISWFGENWNLGVRYLDYSYGRSVARVRAAMESGSTIRFPRLEILLDSIATRAAGAPDRQFVATVGRAFAHASIQVDWAQQRDALTLGDVKSLSLTYAHDIGDVLRLDVTAGYSDGTASKAMSFGGLALTWQSQPARK